MPLPTARKPPCGRAYAEARFCREAGPETVGSMRLTPPNKKAHNKAARNTQAPLTGGFGVCQSPVLGHFETARCAAMPARPGWRAELLVHTVDKARLFGACFTKRGVRSSGVRTSDCGSEGRGFEARRTPKKQGGFALPMLCFLRERQQCPIIRRLP